MKIPQIGRSDYNCLSLPISNSKLFASPEPKGFSDWWALRHFWGLSKENCCGSFLSWKGHVSGEEHHSLAMKTRNQGILERTWCSEIWSRERFTIVLKWAYKLPDSEKDKGDLNGLSDFLPQKLQEFMETREQVRVLSFLHRGWTVSLTLQSRLPTSFRILALYDILTTSSEPLWANTKSNNPLNGIEEPRRRK